MVEYFPEPTDGDCRICSPKFSRSDSGTLLPLVTVDHPLESSKGLGAFKDDVIQITDAMCIICGTVQRLPMPKEQQVEDFYAQVSAELGHFRLFQNPDEQEFRSGQANFVREHGLANGGGTVLDIGAFNGGLVLKLLENGVNAYGIDKSVPLDQLDPRLEGRFQSRHLKEQLELPNRYELAILSHVLEHVVNPVEFLKQVKGLLIAEGKIFLEVPNVLEAPEDDFVPFTSLEHTFNFSPSSLELTCKIAGFEVEVMKLESDVPAVGSVIRAIISESPDSKISTEIDPSRVVRDLSSVASKIAKSGKFIVGISDSVEEFRREFSGTNFVIFGAGISGYRLLEIFQQNSLHPDFFVDSDSEKASMVVKGVEIRPPGELELVEGIVVVISSRAYLTEIRQSLATINPQLKTWSPWG